MGNKKKEIKSLHTSLVKWLKYVKGFSMASFSSPHN